MYTGVLASSLRLKDLLDKQQQRQQQQPPSQQQRQQSHAARGEPPGESAELVGEAAAAVNIRRQGNDGSVPRSQLAQLARMLLDPANGGSADSLTRQHPTANPGGQAADGSHSQVAGSGRAPTAAEAMAIEGGDVSMAELDACLATGSVMVQVEVPTSARAAAGRQLEQPPAGIKGEPRHASKAAADPVPAAASPSCVAGGGSQLPLWRCSSPLDLCQAVHSAQARAKVTAAGALVTRSPVAAAPGALATAAVTPTQHPGPGPAPEQCGHTPGSARIRLQLPEPCPVKDLEASPQPHKNFDKRRGGSDSSPNAAAADGPSGFSRGGGSGGLADSAQRKGASVGGRSRSVSRLNPVHPSNKQTGCGAPKPCPEVRFSAAAAAEAAGGGQSKVPATVANGELAGCAAHEQDDGGAEPRRKIVLGENARDEAAAPCGGDGGGTAAAGAAQRGPSADRTPAVAGASAAMATCLATVLSPTPSPHDTDPWATIAQLAARATTNADTSSQRRRRRRKSDAAPSVDLTVEAIDLTAEAIDLTAEVEAEGPAATSRVAAQAAAGDACGGAAASGRVAPDDGAETAAAAAAVTVQQLSAGDDEDYGASSPAGEEQQQPVPAKQATADKAASSLRPVSFSEAAPRPVSEGRGGRGRKGRGRGRGRGRRPLAAGTEPGKAAAAGAPPPLPAANGEVPRGHEDAATAAMGVALDATALPSSLTPRPTLGLADGAGSGEESSPDVPIGKLAAAAAAAAAGAAAGPAQPELPQAQALSDLPAVTPAAPNRAGAAVPAVAPTAGGILGLAVLVPASAGRSSARAPDSLDVPIGVLAAGAIAAATKSPGSSPNPGKGAVEPLACVAAGGPQQGPADKKQPEGAAGSGAASGSGGAGSAEVSEAGAEAEGRKKRRKRRRRSPAPTDGKDADAAEDPAVAGTRCDPPAAQLEAAVEQAAPQPSAATLAAPSAPPKANAGTAASEAGAGAKVTHPSGPSGAPLEATSANLAAEAGAAQPPSIGAPGTAASKLQLSQKWKRQRICGAPPPAALLAGGSRPGPVGRPRLLAGAGAPSAGPQPPQPARNGGEGGAQGPSRQTGAPRPDTPSEEYSVADGRTSSGADGAAKAGVMDVAMADRMPGEEGTQPERQQDGVSASTQQDAPLAQNPQGPHEPGVDSQAHDQRREDNGSGSSADNGEGVSRVLDAGQSQKKQQAMQCEPEGANDTGTSAAAANLVSERDTDGSGMAADRDYAPPPLPAAVSRGAHLRSMWKRPRLAEAPRPAPGMTGPTGRRVLLGGGLRAGPAVDARTGGGEGRAAAASANGTSPIVDGECEVRLQPAAGEAGAKSGDAGAQAKEAAVRDSATGTNPTGSGSGSDASGLASGTGPRGDGAMAMEEDPTPGRANSAAPAAVAAAVAQVHGAHAAGAFGSLAGADVLHRTPPRAPRLPVALAAGVAAPSPRASAGGSLGKPPRSPGDLRLAGVSLSPHIVPSPSPSSRGGGGGASGHRLRDPSLHPAAVSGSASLSPVQPLLSKFQSAAIPSPRSAVSLAAAAPGVFAAAQAADAASPAAAARARSPLALLAATQKRDAAGVAAAAETSFLQPLAPIRTSKTPQPTGAAPARGAAAAGVKPSVVQAVEALLSIPLLADDGSPDSADAAVAATAAADGDDEMHRAAADSPAVADIAAPPAAVSGCRLERLLDAASHRSVAAAAAAPEPQATALHSSLALLVDAAAAQGSAVEAGARLAPQPGAAAAAEAGREQVPSGGNSDPPSEGPRPLRSAIRGMQRFFSAMGPWVGMSPFGAANSPVQGSAPAGAVAPEAAPRGASGSSGGGVGAGSCFLVCEERLDLFSGKAASPLPPRPRPGGKPPSEASRAAPGGSRLAGRLSPSKALPMGQTGSPVASLRPADGYNTPPCGSSKSRAPLHGPSGWPRSTLYPGHQYDSMIEDVVQQMLNETSPDGPPPLELGRPAACPAAAGPSGTATAASTAANLRDGVTGVVAHQTPTLPASGDENKPLAVNGVAPMPATAAAAAAAGHSPQQTPPLRRSIYLSSPTGKRRRSPGAEEPDTAAADVAADGGGGGDSQQPGADGAVAQPQAPLLGHRRRPRKAARVDGGSAATAAAAACNNMNLDEMSNLGSDDSNSDEDMLDSYAAGGGPGRGAGGQVKAHGPVRGGPGGRGPGSMFAGRLMPYGAPGGSNWMKPGLAWNRTAAAPPGQQPMGPARVSPQIRGPFGSWRPSPTGPGASAMAGARPGPSAGLEPGSPGDSLLDVPRMLSKPRVAGSRRQGTYLSAKAEASEANARPTLEQEYREALINSRLAQAWAAGERWARCDLAGLPADLSKRGVAERLAQLDSAASKLHCYREAEGASKIMAKVEEEWEHLKSIRMAAAARATARTPTGATPSPAPGHFPAGRPPHTPLPFAAHAHAHAVAAAAAVHAAALGPPPGSSQPDAAAAAAATPPPEGAAAAPASIAAPGTAHHGLAGLVSAHAHAHCHRGSPPPPASASQRLHTPSQPPHAHHHHNHSSGNPLHHHHQHSHPHHSLQPGDAQQRTAAAGANLLQAGSQATPTVHPPQGRGGVAGGSQQGEAGGLGQRQQEPGNAAGAGEGFGTPVLRTGLNNGDQPNEATPLQPGGRNAGGMSTLRNPQQLQLTPPASILKTVPTPYTALGAAAMAGALGAGGATLAGTPGGGTATGRKAVQFAPVLELGPQSGYRHTKRPAPLPRPSFDLSQSQSKLEPQQEQQQQEQQQG
ncbi:hypothetical protein PLESTM_000244400 [Pleodorina starrii]|nr:hypothetical protein PLESTM_000244400 [Pleodorina starrii]